MALFHYVACSADGGMREGELEADSARGAARIIRGQALRVLRIEERQGRKGKGFFSFSSITEKHAAFFCRQLAVMAETQSIYDILLAMEKQGGDRAYQKMILDIRKSVELGHGLAISLKKYEDAFSPGAIHLIEAGEASGSLPEFLERLADHLERDFAAREKFRSIMLYPMILALAVFASLAIMLIFILPSFVGLMEGLHVNLPMPTRILLLLGHFLEDWGQWLLAGCVGCSVLFWYLCGKDSFRRRVDRLLLRLPVIGSLKRDVAWMHILGTLSVLQSGGMRMDESLSMVSGVSGNRYLQSFLMDVRKKVRHGSSLTSSLQDPSVFPAMLLQLVAAGESAGRLEEMLLKGANYCQFSAENTSRRLQTLMEPALILVMGSVVLFFVLAILLPLLDSMETIS